MKWLTLSVLFFLVSCSSGQTSRKSISQTGYDLPESLSLSQQSRKFSKGEVLYIRLCSDCHGWEGRGNGPVTEYMRTPAPALLQHKLIISDSEKKFVDVVLNGSAVNIGYNDQSAPKTDAEVSALLEYLRHLPSIDWKKTNRGQQVYDELCISCHGLYGQGDGALSSQLPVSLPDLSDPDFQKNHSDSELYQIVSQGKNAMPGAEDVLDAGQIDSVITFIRLFSPGFINYDRFCAGCHGETGQPMEYMNTDSGDALSGFENIDVPALDQTYFQTHTAQQLRTSIRHMININSVSMPHFADELEPAEAHSIYLYLRSLVSGSR